MATYFSSDFADSSTDWTERYNTTPDWAGGVSGGDLTIPSGAANDWSAFTWNDVDGDSGRADVDVLLLFTTASSITTSQRCIIVRGSGADESATHFHFSIGSGSHSVGYCDASDTRTNLATHSVTYNASTDYWVRFRITGTGGTTTYKTKVWTGAAGDEPGGAGADSNWNLNSTTTSGTSSAGWVGISTFGATGGNVIKQIGVGTNGDTAPSSASSGYTLAADSGSYTLTGTAASLIVGRKLAADSGSYSLSGTAAAFKRGYALTADSGSYTLSGTTVSLTAGRKLAADSGSYTLTGTDVTLNYSPAGSYNLTAESGTYTLTGTAATLKVSRKLTADSGAYPLTGTDVTLSKGVKLTADSGSYTLSGSNVAFSRTYVLTAESGAYTLTGTSAGLTWSGAPVVEAPTNGGPSIYGKPVFREKQFRKEYEEQVKRIEDEKRLARILREDEEITVIMALMAA